MKILLLRAEMFHADGRTNWQTDMTTLIVSLFFSQFCERAN